MAFDQGDTALSTTFGQKKRTDNFDRMSYLTNFSTKRRTRRNVASTKSRMRPIVVSAKWFSSNCRAPMRACAVSYQHSLLKRRVLYMYSFQRLSATSVLR